MPSVPKLDSKLDYIFGNKPTLRDSDRDLADYASYLAKEWVIPRKVLLIDKAESGLHEHFAINYDLTKFPQHSALYLDNEAMMGSPLLLSRSAISLANCVPFLAMKSSNDPLTIDKKVFMPPRMVDSGSPSLGRLVSETYQIQKTSFVKQPLE